MACKHSIQCLFEECNQRKFLESNFGSHLRKKHKISREQYTEEFETSEWVSCRYCNKKYFRSLKQQRTNCNKTCGDTECISKMFEENAKTVNSNRTKESRIKAANSLRKSNAENKILKEQNCKEASVKINLLKPRLNIHKIKTVKHVCSMKINLLYNRLIPCLDEECKKLNLRFTKIGLGSHVSQHHKMSMEEYSRKYKTNEWVKCPYCETFYYRSAADQKSGSKSTCKNKACKKEHFLNETKNTLKKMFPDDDFINNFQASKEKVLSSNKKNYDDPIKRKEIEEKKAETNLRKTGYRSVLQNPENREKCNSLEACQKRYETMKKNNSFQKSKPEDAFFEFLSKYFKEIERQYVMAWWPIDFYIRDIDTFIQLDGEYLHGLTVTEEQLRESNVEKDKQRLLKKISDRRQNTYFKNRNLSLLRISDKEFLSCESDEEVFSKLACISGTNRLSDFFS